MGKDMAAASPSNVVHQVGSIKSGPSQALASDARAGHQWERCAENCGLHAQRHGRSKLLQLLLDQRGGPCAGL